VSDEQCVADVPVSPTPCTEPDQAATTVIPAWPKMPDQALREGTSGTVQVEVMLDAASDLVAAKIYSSPSALLNDDALLTAMRSTYRTAIFHCVTRPAVYIFSVEYDRQ
jgi:outer membrane biosynthesis protein TonB